MKNHTILQRPLGYVGQILLEEGCIVHTGYSFEDLGVVSKTPET